jgi:5-methylcytosine-specific restriction endonuclease McrA
MNNSQLKLDFTRKISFPKIDVSGVKFYRLTVLSYAFSTNKQSYWLVKCDCGIIKTVAKGELGRTKSCGCLSIEHIKRVHKLRKSKLPKIPKPIRLSKLRTVYCNTCGNPIIKTLCYINKKNYCNRQCQHKYSPKTVIKNCTICSAEYNVALAQIKHRGSKYCSILCKRKGMAITMSGEKCPFWKGGKSYESKRIRKGIEWKLWREAVFKRDNYTCQDCGIRSGKGIKVELHPHHIKQYAIHIDLRFDINNGQTLCKECHKKTDTYLKKPLKNGKRTTAVRK